MVFIMNSINSMSVHLYSQDLCFYCLDLDSLLAFMAHVQKLMLQSFLIVKSWYSHATKTHYDWKYIDVVYPVLQVIASFDYICVVRIVVLSQFSNAIKSSTMYWTYLFLCVHSCCPQSCCRWWWRTSWGSGLQTHSSLPHSSY